MRYKKDSKFSLKDSINIQVRFSEVDSMNVVWHGDYIKYLEDGREAFGRKYKGIGYMDIKASGYLAPIVNLNIDYKRSLVCNDRAVVETRYIDSDAAKILFEYIIYRESDMEIMATAQSMQVFLDANGSLQLMNPEFYDKWKTRWGIR